MALDLHGNPVAGDHRTGRSRDAPRRIVTVPAHVEAEPRATCFPT